MRTPFFIVSVLALIASSFAHASEFSDDSRSKLLEILSDSGIKGPAYSVLVESFVKLQNEHPDYVEVVQYGQSLKGRPLVGLKISNKAVTPPAQAKTILIAGSIHGNEYLNVEDRLPTWVVTDGLKNAAIQNFFKAGGMFLFAPILNPDGYDARERENAHGVDLNRDFTLKRKNHVGFKEKETLALGEWVRKETYLLNRSLNLTVDYHCCIGAMLRPWGFKGDLPASDEAKYNDVQTIYFKSFSKKDYQYGRTPDILGYESVGTSKDYYYEAYRALAFTFEGKRSVENKNFSAHTQMWTDLVGYVNQLSSAKGAKRSQTLF